MKPKLLTVAAVALLLLYPGGAQASGPGTGGRTIELQDQPAGPYLVTVFSSPAPPVTENLYLEIRVKDSESARVIAGGSVFVRAEPAGFQAEPVMVEATHDIAPLEIDFAAHLPLPSPGTWHITLEIDGPRGAASLAFPLQVNRTSAGSPLTWPLAFLAGLALFGTILAVRRRQLAAGQGERTGLN